MLPWCFHGAPIVFPSCSQGALKVLSRCSQGVLKVQSRCFQGVLKVLSMCSQGALKVYSRCTQGAFKVHSRCTLGAVKVRTRCTQSVYKVRSRWIQGGPNQSKVGHWSSLARRRNLLLLERLTSLRNGQTVRGRKPLKEDSSKKYFPDVTLVLDKIWKICFRIGRAKDCLAGSGLLAKVHASTLSYQQCWQLFPRLCV